MSKAYICDKCGKIQQEPMKELWSVNPLAYTEAPPLLHLCDGCYEQFEREYFANLRESEGFHE